jgi:hypothetical protein
MKPLHTWVYCISLLLTTFIASGQDFNSDTSELETIDSLAIKSKIPLGLRVGADLFRIVRSQVDENYQGFEAVADFQIKKNVFIAAEVGNESLTKQVEKVNFTTQGTYFKIGFDLNMFENWEGMDNVILIGLRLASSSHSQFLNSYTLLDRTSFWEDPETLTSTGFATGERQNLNAYWLEVISGFKVEIIKNVYLGLSLRVNRLLKDKIPDNFDNIHIPGFNKKTEENKFGASFNYTLTYRIPFR